MHRIVATLTLLVFPVVCLAQEPDSLASSQWLEFSTLEGFGFIDRTGAVRIEPRFKAVTRFSEGLAGVQVNGGWGFIDTTGVIVIEPRPAAGVGLFINGVARVVFRERARGSDTNFRVRLIDRGGNYLNISEDDLPPLPAEANSLAPRRSGKKYGYVDSTATWVIKPKFDDAEGFHDGVAAVKVGKKWGYIDTAGNWVLKPRFSMPVRPIAGEQRPPHFGDGLIPVLEDGKWGYMDRTGAWAIKPRFFEAAGFSEGLAAVSPDGAEKYGLRLPGKTGYIDTTGRFVIQPRFRMAGEFANGRAVAAEDLKKEGLIDREGNWVVEPVYDRIFLWDEGLAEVEVHGLIGYVRLDDGSPLVDPRRALKASPVLRNLQWGMSPGEVREAEEAARLITAAEDMLIYSDRAGGLPVKLVCVFVNGELGKIMYQFEPEHTNKNEYIEDYRRLQKAFRDKYGEPKNQGSRWLNRLFAGDREKYGLAVSMGHLVYGSVWELPGTRITLGLRGDNFEVALGVVYESLAHEEAFEDQKKRGLEDIF